MRISLSLSVLAAFVALSNVSVQAQTYATPAPQSASASATITAKVVAVDQKNRILTLQDPQGNKQDVKVGPDVKRFNEIKVGDTITATYQESVALAIVKPGTAVPASQSSPSVTRGTGSRPSGTISQTQTATVTVQSIDMNKPSVTVKTQDGRVLTFAVQDKNNLTGLKVGDVVQITYTQAIVLSVQ